ncbi:TPA: phage protein NinX family protein [Morganella morganii]
MNKYRDKSDFEINKAVAEIYLHGKHLLSEENQEVYFGGMDGGDFLPNGYFDPCNNPADAMPIVIRNKITVAYDKLHETWCAHVGSVMSGDGGWDYSIEPVINYCDDNYYRAAMICFLIMKDAENEKS